MFCCMVIFPGLTQLDMTGPFEVLSRVPGVTVGLAALNTEPVIDEHGLKLLPDYTFDNAPQADILLIPGGTGVNNTLLDDRYISFVRRQAEHAKWITSVCTGALLLGAAGLLRGYRAATHWRSMEFLPALGAIPTDERVVIDRNRITGGGITAGIDFGLTLAAHIAGEAIAREIQLMLEYNPHPPFNSGHPKVADPATLASLSAKVAPAMERRRALIEKVSQSLPGNR